MEIITPAAGLLDILTHSGLHDEGMKLPAEARRATAACRWLRSRWTPDTWTQAAPMRT